MGVVFEVSVVILEYKGGICGLGRDEEDKKGRIG